MPRYFFDVRDHDFIRDETGVELEGPSAARLQAIGFAGALLKDNPGGKFLKIDNWRIEVRDEAGLILFTLTFQVRDHRTTSPNETPEASS